MLKFKVNWIAIIYFLASTAHAQDQVIDPSPKAAAPTNSENEAPVDTSASSDSNSTPLLNPLSFSLMDSVVRPAWLALGSPQFSVGLGFGMVDLKSDVKREVDKQGTIVDTSIHAHWTLGDVALGAGLGYAVGEAKGSGPNTIGDQTASLSSSYLDLRAAYEFSSPWSLALGLQYWLDEGADFAREKDTKSNVGYGFAEFRYKPASTYPLSYSLRYAKAVNISDREVSVISLGLDYYFNAASSQGASL